jgi:hypothetical protein
MTPIFFGEHDCMTKFSLTIHFHQQYLKTTQILETKVKCQLKIKIAGISKFS